MDHYHELLSELREPTKSLRRAIPDAWSGFMSTHAAAMADGELPSRLKEAVALAIAAVKRCDGCIAYHAKAAARAGATPGEVAELLGIALLMDGGTATVYAPRAWDAYLEFRAEQTPIDDVEPARPLLEGLAASPGTATGVVRIMTSPSSGEELQPGEVLVAPMTNPASVPTICRAAALITDGGGMTCHAAILARELGVPCVVGTRTATSTLGDGEMVTVDGARGFVYEGVVAAPAAATLSSAAA